MSLLCIQRQKALLSGRLAETQGKGRTGTLCTFSGGNRWIYGMAGSFEQCGMWGVGGAGKVPCVPYRRTCQGTEYGSPGRFVRQ